MTEYLAAKKKLEQAEYDLHCQMFYPLVTYKYLDTGKLHIYSGTMEWYAAWAVYINNHKKAKNWESVSVKANKKPNMAKNQVYLGPYPNKPINLATMSWQEYINFIFNINQMQKKLVK